MQQTRTYRERSRAFLTRASGEFANGDLAQASEKAWGAAALMVKAVAESRGWRHQNHSALFNTVANLARETGDVEIEALFLTASRMHTNFYEDWYGPSQVENGIAEVARFIEKLENILDQQT